MTRCTPSTGLLTTTCSGRTLDDRNILCPSGHFSTRDMHWRGGFSSVFNIFEAGIPTAFPQLARSRIGMKRQAPPSDRPIFEEPLPEDLPEADLSENARIVLGK